MKKLKKNEKAINIDLQGQNIVVKPLTPKLKDLLGVNHLGTVCVTTYGEPDKLTVFLDPEVRVSKSSKTHPATSVRDLSSMTWVDYGGSCCRDIVTAWGGRVTICYPPPC